MHFSSDLGHLRAHAVTIKGAMASKKQTLGYGATIKGRLLTSIPKPWVGARIIVQLFFLF